MSITRKGSSEANDWAQKRKDQIENAKVMREERKNGNVLKSTGQSLMKVRGPSPATHTAGFHQQSTHSQYAQPGYGHSIATTSTSIGFHPNHGGPQFAADVSNQFMTQENYYRPSQQQMQGDMRGSQGFNARNYSQRDVVNARERLKLLKTRMGSTNREMDSQSNTSYAGSNPGSNFGGIPRHARPPSGRQMNQDRYGDASAKNSHSQQPSGYQNSNYRRSFVPGSNDSLDNSNPGRATLQHSDSNDSIEKVNNALLLGNQRVQNPVQPLPKKVQQKEAPGYMPSRRDAPGRSGNTSKHNSGQKLSGNYDDYENGNTSWNQPQEVQNDMYGGGMSSRAPFEYNNNSSQNNGSISGNKQGQNSRFQDVEPEPTYGQQPAYAGINNYNQSKPSYGQKPSRANNDGYKGEQPMGFDEYQSTQNSSQAKTNKYPGPSYDDGEIDGSNSGYGAEIPDHRGMDGPDNRIECPSCGRKFNPDVLGKHAKNCQKVFMQKRKKFDIKEQRQATDASGQGLEDGMRYKPKQRQAAAQKKPVAKAGNEDAPVGNRMPAWKAKSEAFRQAMQVTNAPVGGNGDHGYAPPQQPAYDDRVECQYCGRKFNQTAAERHIPVCQNKFKTNQIKQGGGGKRSTQIGFKR